MQTKEKYMTPELEIIEFDCEDIIITSTIDSTDPNSRETQPFVE